MVTYKHLVNFYHIIFLSNPDLLHQMQEQGFSVSLSGLPYSRIPCDQVIQMTINHSSKDTGGLSGKTEDVGASERWMHINYIMAALREHLDALIKTKSWNKHVDLGRKRMLSDENDVATLSDCLTEWTPNLWNPDQPLVNIATGQRASEEMVENVRTCQEREVEAMKKFEVRFTIQESTEMSKKSYYDTIPRQKVITFQSTKPKKKLTMDEDETKSFAEVLSCFDEK